MELFLLRYAAQAIPSPPRSFLMTLDEKFTLKGTTSPARHLLWSRDGKMLAVLEERGLALWDVPSLIGPANFGKKEALWSKNLHGGSGGARGAGAAAALAPAMECGRWDPADPHRAWAAWGTEVQVISYGRGKIGRTCSF